MDEKTLEQLALEERREYFRKWRAVKAAERMIRHIEVEDNKKVVPASPKADTTKKKYKSSQA